MKTIFSEQGLKREKKNRRDVASGKAQEKLIEKPCHLYCIFYVYKIPFP